MEQILDLTGDSGVLKKTLQLESAMSSKSQLFTPPRTAKVRITYSGSLENGMVVDMATKEKPKEFTLGVGDVIKGWDVAVASMKKGEKAEFTILPQYAYGEKGSTAKKIPPNSVLNYEIELLSWEDRNDLSKDGGVIRKTLKRGVIDRKPTHGFEVSVHYVGKLSNGEVFYSTRDNNQTLTWFVGENTVLKCFNVAVMHMAVGDVYLLKVRSDYAYGEKGNAEFNIGPNTNIEIEIELMESYEINRIAIPFNVKKKILRQGERTATPFEGIEATVLVKGCADNSHPFHVINEPTTFKVGSGELPELIDMGIESMKWNELAVFTFYDSDMCHGSHPLFSEKIEHTKAQKFTYEVELISFEKKKAPEYSGKEAIQEASRLKDVGNSFFKGGRLRMAYFKYQKALTLLEKASAKQKSIEDIQLLLHLNVAAVSLKWQKYEETIKHCDKVLEIDKSNLKAFFRRGQAHYHRGYFDEAKSDFIEAEALSNDDQEIKQWIRQVNQKLKIQLQKEKKTFARLFAKLALEDQELEKSKENAEAQDTNV